MTKAKRLILHIGHGKTGSTSIQRALRASDKQLAAQGILFPDPGRHDNHQLLFPYLHEDLPDDPVQLQSLGRDPAQIMKQAESLWHDLLRRIEREQPETVVLSCENQFRPFPEAAIRRLAQLSDQIAEQTEVYAWLRSPAPFFLSNVQQNVKKRPEFRFLTPTRCRDVLEPFLLYGNGPVHARLFAREALIDGDAVSDFCHAALPQIDPKTLTRGLSEENTSVSAEAMALLQEIFREARPLPRGVQDRKALRKIVVAQDAVLPGKIRPKLFEHVRAIVEARVTEYSWLEETFGIVFPDVGPAEMPQAQAEAAYAALRDITDICSVNAARQEALWQATCAAATQGGVLDRLVRKLGLR